MTMIEAYDEHTLEQAIQNSRLTLVEYGTPWCPPCRTLLPILEEVGAAFHSVVAIVKVDCEQLPDAASRAGIMGMPTVLLYKDGEPLEKLVGLRPRVVYEELIRKHRHA